MSEQLRDIYRVSEDGKREKVRMYDLRPGDNIEIEEDGRRSRFVVESEPTQNADTGVWGVEARTVDEVSV